ncbi:MAG TPA: helix-turn-helix domain-containing protein [Myxococcota bacterium]|nr:helix-turn-helix domain-containing protein [Myxococcota bacterium]
MDRHTERSEIGRRPAARAQTSNETAAASGAARASARWGVDLLERCLAGDRTAWTALVLALDPVIVRCLVRGLGPQRAYALDDLRIEVLEALVARDMLVLRLLRGRPFDELRRYMHRVARNKAVSHVRRGAARARAEAAFSAVPTCNPEPGLAGLLDAERALEGLDAQRPVGRAALIARLRAAGHTLPEICAQAGVSEATVLRTLRDWRAAARA